MQGNEQEKATVQDSYQYRSSSFFRHIKAPRQPAVSSQKLSVQHYKMQAVKKLLQAKCLQ